MSTDLTTFTIPTGGELRALVEDGDPWFIAADVAPVLGHRDAANMTRVLDDDERGTRLVSTPSGDQQMTVISEPGLYRAIMQRQTGRVTDEYTRNAIKNFQRWVTHEVLPTIRKTGRYGTAMRAPQTYAEALRELAASVEAKEQAHAALEAAKPMVDAWQTFLDTAGDMSVADTAKALARAGINIGPRELYRELHVWGWIFRAESRHTGKVGPWKAKQTQVDCGRLAMKPTQFEDRLTGELRDGDPQVRITPKGVEEIRRRLDRGEQCAIGGAA